MFQQDNASYHVSYASRSWLEANSVKLLDSLARSPDLKYIDNLRDILAREVYKNGIHYAGELISSIELAWKNIFQQTLTEHSGSVIGLLIRKN